MHRSMAASSGSRHRHHFYLYSFVATLPATECAYERNCLDSAFHQADFLFAYTGSIFVATLLAMYVYFHDSVPLFFLVTFLFGQSFSLPSPNLFANVHSVLCAGPSISRITTSAWTRLCSVSWSHPIWSVTFSAFSHSCGLFFLCTLSRPCSVGLSPPETLLLPPGLSLLFLSVTFLFGLSLLISFYTLLGCCPCSLCLSRPCVASPCLCPCILFKAVILHMHVFPLVRFLSFV